MNQKQKSLALSPSDFRAGDRVRLIDREATPEETKKRIFYNHMRGLEGIVRRVYEDENEVWVDVDRESLPEEVRQRHEESERQMRDKWLDSLSEEARRKLGDSAKQFALRYSVLTTPNHLILEERGAETIPSAPTAQAEAPSAQAASTGTRKTAKDLDAAEQEFLNRAMEGRGAG